MIFTSDEVISKSLHEWPKTLLTEMNVLFYFLHAILCPENTIWQISQIDTYPERWHSIANATIISHSYTLTVQHTVVLRK